MSSGTKGLITRIIGPVVDVTFPEPGETPEIFNALEVDTGNGKLVLETLQQLGDGVVRCISMHATDGLSRGMFAMDTGECITIPVGEKTLGRMLNVSGDPIDWGDPLSHGRQDRPFRRRGGGQDRPHHGAHPEHRL